MAKYTYTASVHGICQSNGRGYKFQVSKPGFVGDVERFLFADEVEYAARQLFHSLSGATRIDITTWRYRNGRLNKTCISSFTPF